MTERVEQPVREDLMEHAAELLIHYPFQRWFYGDSVAFEGLLVATDATGDARWRAFAHGFLRAGAAKPEPFEELDNAMPGHALCLLYEATEDELLLAAAQELAAYLASRRRIDGVFVSFEQSPLRSPYGGGSASDSDLELIADPGPGIFVDPLHFDPPFFAHLARIVVDESLASLAAEQALGYARFLQDTRSGLFSHFWLEKTGRTYGQGWSRGQGWALLGLVDVLELLPESIPERAQLVDALSRLVDALARTQRADGHWYAVAHEPKSGDEHSTAAFVAAGLFKALDDGLLDDDVAAAVAERAWVATLAAVDGRGLLTEVSRCVWPCTIPSHYHHVPRGDPEPWGQGPLLLALARASTRKSHGGPSW